MNDYYRGQRVVAITGALVAIGLLLVAWAFYDKATYPSRSFAIVVALVAGVFMLPANIVYCFYVGRQSARLRETFQRDAVEFRDVEEAHLQKMMRGFQRSYRLDGALVLVGLILAAAGFMKENNRLCGIGLAVALCATTLLAGEIWSKQRALQYRDALQSQQQPL